MGEGCNAARAARGFGLDGRRVLEVMLEASFGVCSRQESHRSCSSSSSSALAPVRVSGDTSSFAS